MSARQANCPSCGADISFRPGTLVSVCSFCSSVVAKAEQDLELLGKAAALLDTHSPLGLGVTGAYLGSGFSLVGRTQLRHPAGGVWDEWYLAFDDGRWGWMAEAQGRFYLTFKTRGAKFLPELEDCHPGGEVDFGLGGRWVVQEVGTATVVTAEGELPYAFGPDQTYDYVDLSGLKGAFATLDYSERPPTLFLGREVSLADLQLEVVGRYTSRPAVRTETLSCPHCGGPLTLRTPDLTRRVTCPSCDSLLDTSAGSLKYLESIPAVEERILIPPGTEGMLGGMRFTAIGFLRRACVVDSIKYHWSEYLLYNPEEGFRWLMESDGHWNFIESVPAAEVGQRGSTVRYQDRTFRKFQEVMAVVERVRGEFYWQVEVGERVLAADYVAPPQVLSMEASSSTAGGQRPSAATAREVNWSLGTYLTGEEVWKAFKLKGSPPSTTGIAPNQPSPVNGQLEKLLPWTVGFLIALGALLLAVAVTSHETPVFRQTYTLPFTPDDKGEQVVFSDPFPIADTHHAIEVRVNSDVSNSWLGISGALVNETTGQVSTFEIENSYYFGNDGGESWSEGSPHATVYLSAMPAGQYVLRLAPVWDTSRKAPSFDVTVTTGAFRGLYAGLAAILVLLGPVLVAILHAVYENRRWQESMYSSGGEE